MLIDGYRPVEGIEMSMLFDSESGNVTQKLGCCSRIKNCWRRCIGGMRESYQNGSLRMGLLTTYGFGVTLLFSVLAGKASDTSHKIGFGVGSALSGIGTILMGCKTLRLIYPERHLGYCEE